MKEHIGDSVYAECDGCGIILTTENGMSDDPSNFIYLDTSVLAALIKFCKTCKVIQ
jgi:hypothetical protein